MIDQLPKQQEVDFLRRSRQQFGSSSGFHDDDNDTAEKVLHVTPGQGGMISFKVDFEKDGVGGQHPGAHSPSTSSGDSVVGPLEVIVQTGEYQVIHSLIQSSLPHLVGWTTMMELAMQRSISDSLNNSGAGGGGGGNRGRRPRYSTSEGDLLF